MKNVKKILEKTENRKQLRLGIIVTAFFVGILSFLSVGFALYTQVLNIDGTYSFRPQGEFRISNVIKTTSQNTDNGVPSFTDDTVDFNLTFVKSNDPDAVYTASYDIVFTNDTFYDRTISSMNFSFDLNNELGEPFGTLNYTISGVDSGGMVPKLSEVTATVDFVFTPLVDQDIYEIDGEVEVDSNEKPEGTILAYLKNTTGDIRNGGITSFQVNVMSSYENSVSFNLEPVSDKVVICDSSGNPISGFTISGNNDGQDFTFYMKAKDGATFPDDTLSTSILLKATGLPNVNCGTVTLDVDKTIVYVDTTPPIISNVVATIQDTVGEVHLSWYGEDDYSGVLKYIVLVCDESGNVLQTIDTNSDYTEKTITGLSNGSVATTYNFKVYGVDLATPANQASASDISSATTSSGYCSASGNASYQWVYKITTNISNGSYSGATEVNRNEALSDGRIQANTLYELPSSITVSMGGQTLNTSSYTYNQNQGTVSIPRVTGDVVITATCNFNWCLAEGTEILLANGSVKRIEDVRYTDLLSVWNYDTGEIDYEYPIWIEKQGRTKRYQRNTFSDGTVLNTIGYHGVFSVDLNQFVSVDDPDSFKVGTRVYKIENNQLKEVMVTKIEQIEEEMNYYHVVSSRYYNIIANDILTTDGTVILSNLYGFDSNITWPSTRELLLEDSNNLYSYSDLADVLPPYMFIGMRAREGKILQRYGLSLEAFKYYLSENQSKEGKYLEVNHNEKGENLFMVTTSFDKINSSNYASTLYVENSMYTLPRDFRVKCYLNSIDKKCYAGGEQVSVTAPIHFQVIYQK